MSVAHTPGPWMVLPSVVPSQFVILTAEGPRRDIACTYGFGHDPREANARLIAAAPALLKALRVFTDFPADTLDDLRENPEQVFTFSVRGRDMSAACAAIAAATQGGA